MSSQILQRQTYQKGEFVFKEGDEGNLAYILQDGEVEIVKNTETGIVVLATVRKGGMFGEMALIDSKPRMAGARAGKGSTVIVVNRQMFEEKLKKADPFIRGLLKIFVDRVRSTNK